MQKFYFAWIIFFLASLTTLAQRVQWASEVLEATTELGDNQYAATQALGPPNVGPNDGESPNAWVPGRNNKIEYIKVSFEDPFQIRQIAIAESFNPTAVYQVFIYDEEDNEFLVNTFNPRDLELDSRMLRIFFDLTDFNVAAVKVVLDAAAIEGFPAIDAIGISNSTIPLKQDVLITESFIVSVNPERLQESVNSIYNELKPMITPDGKTLMFSRQFHPGNIGGIDDPEDIWFSTFDENTQEWLEAENMGAPFNNEGPNFISSITPDGNTVILTLGNRYTKRGKMKAGASMVTRTSQGWSRPINFDIKNLVNVSEKSNFFLANNREVLLLSLESSPSYGSRDIYVSFLQDDGTWSTPANLGEDINTASEDFAPFLATDDKTLYFSSRGYPGFGKSDIYVSKRLDDTWQKWSKPENLGSLINSETDDAFFNIPPTGEYGYFVRDVEGSNNDIFRFELPVEHRPEPVVTISGVVYNAKTREPIQARIFYEELPDGKEIGTINSDPVTGEYQIILPSGELYGYLAESSSYLSISANIDLTENISYNELTKDLYLVPVEVGATITLNNIFFDFDKDVLKEASFPELNRIIDFMIENPSVQIEISGHTDNIGPEEYNQNLSERRALAVAIYLQENGGLPGSRMITMGYGETNPTASNDDEEDGRELNRRVEFKIIEE